MKTHKLIIKLFNVTNESSRKISLNKLLIFYEAFYRLTVSSLGNHLTNKRVLHGFFPWILCNSSKLHRAYVNGCFVHLLFSDFRDFPCNYRAANCSPVYPYRHLLDFTNDITLFQVGYRQFYLYSCCWWWWRWCFGKPVYNAVILLEKFRKTFYYNWILIFSVLSIKQKRHPFKGWA